MSSHDGSDVHPGDRPAGNARGTRSSVMARHGLVATSQPLASSAGLAVLRAGGNAVDAAVTAAAVLCVVEPAMTGIGGDLFALVFDAASGRLRALNSSGRAPARAHGEWFRTRGFDTMPMRGALSITIPGVIDGWSELLVQHGTIGLAQALDAAIAYARDGFPVSEIVAGQWAAVEDILRLDADTARTFLPRGRAPRPGEVFANPGLARTLAQVASGGRDAFYEGDLTERLCTHLAGRGSLIDAADFAARHADWVEPLRTSYRGVEVCELPPNTQGFVVLEMLNILEGDDLAALGHNSGAYLHLLVEAKRLAFADRDAFLADPREVPPDILATLISKDYAASRRGEIDPRRAAKSVMPGLPPRRTTQAGISPAPPIGTGDTVYLTVVDARGNAVSLIQSLFGSFGSAIVAGDTGVVFQNRGSLFSLDAAHPNCIAPGKRPLHTLIPGMALREGKPWLSFGVMGGDMQPQGHVQVLLNLLHFDMTVQDAGDAARFRHTAAGVALESNIRVEARDELLARGHTLVETPGVFGGFQGIVLDHAANVLIGGSDMRKDGAAVGF